MGQVFFSSALKSNHRDQLERLIFFNPLQEKARVGILECVETYGKPRIIEDGELLRIGVGSFPDVQSLFALEQLDGEETGRLIGLVVYVRVDLENLLVLHVAVDEEFAAGGKRVGELVVLRLFIQLRQAASRIKGVKMLSLVYQGNSVRGIPIPERTSAKV